MLRYLVDPIFQVINTAGKPATGGYVEVYLHGTRDKYYCASDFEGTLHPFKIPLDSLGANIILADDANAYDIYVYNRYGSLLMSRYNVFPVQVGVFPSDLKTLTLKKGNRVLGTYSPLEQKSIDVSEIVFLDEQNPNLYQVIAQLLLSDMVPVLTKSNLDPDVPGGVRRDYYYYPTSRTGVGGDYSFIGYDGQRSEIATVHDDDSVTYTKIEVPTASTASPSMDGIASAGSSTQWSSGDHVHPTDTSREATANKTTTVRQNGQADNTKFPTEAAVRTAIDSAVSSAYHAAGSKTVAQLISSLLVSANEGDVYNITDSGTTTADFIEGAGHPISVGDNVVVCDVGAGVYKFDLLSGFVDLTYYLTKTGDGSDVTASFTAASTRTNISTGEKLSVLFGKIAKWFGDLKALAFKDKVNTSDIDDDAVTADKVKDGETLPANVTGSAKSLSSSLCSYGSSGSKFRLVMKSAPLGDTVNVHFECRISAANFNIFQSATLLFNAVYSQSDNAIVFSNAKIINDYGSSNLWRFYLVPKLAEHKVEIYAEAIGHNYNSLNLIALFANGEGQNYVNGTTYFNTVVNSIPTPNVVVPVRTAVSTETGVGNAATPVYIDNQGVPQPCDIRGVNTVVAEFTHTLTSSEVSNGYFEFTIDSSTAFTTSSTFGAIKNAALYDELILLQTNTALNHDAVCFDISHFNYDVDSASSASFVRWPLIMGKNVSGSYAKGLLAVPIENVYNGTLDSISIRVNLPQGIFAANDTIRVKYNVTTIR